MNGMACFSPGHEIPIDPNSYLLHLGQSALHKLFKDEIEGKKTSMLAQMYDRKRILVMLQIMSPNISY